MERGAMTPNTRFSREIMPAFKTIARSYVYWIGLTLGIAVLPGSLLYTAGIAPRATPLFLAPLTAIALLWLDLPSSWPRSNASSLYLRLCGTALATLMLPGYDGFFDVNFGSNHWIFPVLSFWSTWTLYALALLYTKRVKQSELKREETNPRLWIRSYVAWMGIFHGMFGIPTWILVAFGTLLAIVVMYTSVSTGLILAFIDPPRGWKSLNPSQFWIRISATFIAASMMTLESVIYRDEPYGYIKAMDPSESLILFFTPWILYMTAVGIAYYGQLRPLYSHTEHLEDERR